MLRSIDEMIGYELLIEGKSVGKCKDLLFDDDCWTIRYLLADTGKWLFDKKVLISPFRPRYRSIILALFFGQIKSISDLKPDKNIIL